MLIDYNTGMPIPHNEEDTKDFTPMQVTKIFVAIIMGIISIAILYHIFLNVKGINQQNQRIIELLDELHKE